MTNYDLSILSWTEFEDLSRDLLQCEFDIYIESFTTGKDGGIDLRFAFSKDKKSIVQCKRIGDFNDLYRQLVNEKEKIIDKELDRYLLTTTVGLTPDRKNKIFQLMSPYIKDEADIFGKDDIINLISKHTNIEEKYYKLWLTSSKVLNRILNAKIYNSSNFQIEQINEDAKIYVHNESYNKAQDILKENHYIIISGIPWIGKTTLARILVYDLIASGIDNLIYLSSNIGEAYKSFRENEKQVFLFDDFLGKNFLEDRLDRNEDKELIDFIKKIKTTKNKYFIMTTREYILNQAKQKYEILNRSDIEIVKCIIDLEQYTKLVRGKILFKHLYFSDIPKEYLHELILNRRYLTIINHNNYNPRIIETIIDKKEWFLVSSESFYSIFFSYFENPESVWKHAFEKQISKQGRDIVIILGSINGLIKLEFLRKAVKKIYWLDMEHSIDDFDLKFNEALKELSDSFIKIEKDDNNLYAVEYHNPSVSDFINSFLKNHIDIIKSLINNCVCLDQIITFYKIFQKILPDEIKIISEEKLLKCFNELEIIKLKRSISLVTKKPSLFPCDSDNLAKLSVITRYMLPINNNELLMYIEKIFIDEWKNIKFDSDFRDVINIFINLNEYNKVIYFEKFLNMLIEICDSFEKLSEIKKLKVIDIEIYNKNIKNEKFNNEIIKIAEYEYDNSDDDFYEYTKDQMLDISEFYNVNLDEFINKLIDKINDKEEEDLPKIHKSFNEDKLVEDQENEIIKLFDTLLLK